MSAPENNQFWKQRTKHGREVLFSSASILWEEACEYFKWCDENPLDDEQGFAYQGTVTRENFPKLRAYTLNGLCLFLNVNEAYFRQFNTADKPEFADVIYRIEKAIYEQQYTGAAANKLNPNIIARALGLKDRTDTTSGDLPVKSINIAIDGKNIDLSK